MRIVVIAVGKLKDRALRRVADDYLERIRRYARPEEIEIKDADEETIAARIERAVPHRSQVVALEGAGEGWSSHELARFVEDAENGGVQSLVFVIGGSHGLPGRIAREANVRLQLSRMTLPHRLARVVLLEQIYRAFSIVRNEPYAH